MKQAVVLLSLLCLLAPALGCDKATPVAPENSILAISANPQRITLRGSSTITVIGRKPDGQPLNPGTEVRLTATLGSIDSIVTTDSNGQATATFRNDGRQGTATITATTGSASGGGGGTGTGGTGGTGGGTTSGPLRASIDVQVGEAAKSIILQPTPTTVPETGGTVQLLAIVRDASGQPLPNQGVNFTTDVGQLNSRGAIVQTDSNGQARDRLTVTEADLAGNVSAIGVSAQTPGSDGALATATFSIRVQGGRPVASFEFVRVGPREYQFTDTTSGGVGTLTYSWDFDDDTPIAREANPRHNFSADDTYAVVLTVTDSVGQSDTATAVIDVPTDASGSGQ